MAASSESSTELDHVVVAGATRALRRLTRADGSTVIVKVVHVGDGRGNERWRPTLEPDHAYYWKREPLAYTSGLLAREFDGTFRAPQLVGVRQEDDAVAIELEDVEGVFAPQWSLDQYGITARALGAAQGRYLAGRPLPPEPWISRGFIRAYNGRMGVARNDFVDLVDRLPQAFVHHDLHPGNLFAASDGSVVAIDWAFCGISAFGDDAANLVLDTMLDVVVDARLHASELYELVLDGFRAGLRDAGWDGDQRLIALAIDAGMAAKFLWIDAHLQSVVDNADAQAAIERKYGQPFAEVQAQRQTAMAFMHDRADRVPSIAAELHLR